MKNCKKNYKYDIKKGTHSVFSPKVTSEGLENSRTNLPQGER